MSSESHAEPPRDDRLVYSRYDDDTNIYAIDLERLKGGGSPEPMLATANINFDLGTLRVTGMGLDMRGQNPTELDRDLVLKGNRQKMNELTVDLRRGGEGSWATLQSFTLRKARATACHKVLQLADTRTALKPIHWRHA